MNDVFSPILAPLATLPRDDAAHADLPWELWWFTAEVTSDGRRLGVHLMVNRLSREMVSVTATVTDLAISTEVTERRIAQLDASVLSEERLHVQTEIGEIEGDADGSFHVHAKLNDATAFRINLRPTRPVLYNGGAGSFTLGSASTTQYSRGDLAVQGSVRIEGRAHLVSGHGWFDRQWGNNGPLEDLGGGFNWFGLYLDNGDVMSVWDTTERPAGGHSWVTIARPDGTHIITAIEPLAKGATGAYRTRNGRLIPKHWDLRTCYGRTRLSVEQQTIQDGDRLYLGLLTLTGFCEDRPVSGHGFCDIVGPIEK